MTDFDVRNAERVDQLVKDIRNHADAKALRRELFRGMNRATKELRGALKEIMPAALPTSGGLSAVIQGSTRWNTSAKAGRNAGVTLWAKNSKHDIRTLTGKRLRHPVWGNRSVWVNQTAGVEPAVFLAEFDKQKPDVQRDIVRVMEDVARKVEGH